jgi:hypothetical protein
MRQAACLQISFADASGNKERIEFMYPLANKNSVPGIMIA